MGPQVLVPLDGGRLALGTWQGIFFCELDGPRERTVLVTPALAWPEGARPCSIERVRAREWNSSGALATCAGGAGLVGRA